MKAEEVEKIKRFYEDVILEQIIKPIEINDIYVMIHKEELNPSGLAYKIKVRAICAYITKLQTEVLEDLNALFSTAETFSEPLNSWNVSGVTNMTEMFANVRQSIDKTEMSETSASTSMSVSSSTDAYQSHSEDSKDVLLINQIRNLEEMLIVADNAKAIKTIKFKITTLRKKLSNDTFFPR